MNKVAVYRCDFCGSRVGQKLGPRLTASLREYLANVRPLLANKDTKGVLVDDRGQTSRLRPGARLQPPRLWLMLPLDVANEVKRTHHRAQRKACRPRPPV